MGFKIENCIDSQANVTTMRLIKYTNILSMIQWLMWIVSMLIRMKGKDHLRFLHAHRYNFQCFINHIGLNHNGITSVVK